MNSSNRTLLSSTSPPSGDTGTPSGNTSPPSSNTGSEESAILCPTSGRLHTMVLRKDREREQAVDQKRLASTRVNDSRVSKKATQLRFRIPPNLAPRSSSEMKSPSSRSFRLRRTTRGSARNSAVNEDVIDRWRRFWSSPLLPRPYVSSRHSHSYKKRMAILKRRILEIWQEHEILLNTITPPETSGKMIEVQNLLKQYDDALANFSKRYGVNITTKLVSTREISEDEGGDAESESEYDDEIEPVINIRFWTKFRRGRHGANRLVIISNDSLISSMLLLFDAAQLRSFPKTRFEVETVPYKMNGGSHGICHLPKRFVDIAVISERQWDALLEVERWSKVQTGAVGLYLVRVQVGNKFVEAFEWLHIGESDACSKALDRTSIERARDDDLHMDDLMDVDNLTEKLQETDLQKSSSESEEG